MARPEAVVPRNGYTDRRAEPVVDAVTDSLDKTGVLRAEYSPYRDVDPDAFDRRHAHATARESVGEGTVEYGGRPVRVRLGRGSDGAGDTLSPGTL